MNSKDLPDDLKVSMTQENDQGEVTFVVLESSGKIMLATAHAAVVDKWRQGLPWEVRIRADSIRHAPHVRALDAAIRAVENNVADGQIVKHLETQIIAEIADEFGIERKNLKDVLGRYRKAKK
jgi:hypothetical protein